MARSAFVEVNITNSTKLAQDSQNTADNAVKGVTDLNDPNLMSVIEKQNNVAQFAGLTSQYNVIVQNAKDEGIDTTAVTTAYNNLNKFMADVLAEPDHASDVNRDTYKSLTDAYNTALNNVQNALSNSFNTDIGNMRSSVSVASQAASNAVIVASQAAITGDNASQVASQAVVVAGQAKSAGNNATSIANSASQAASSAVLAGSTAAVNADKASADYQTLSAGVKNGSVVHITTETAIDKGVIGTAEIANAAITDAQVGNVSANKLTAGAIDFNTITGKNINASNITTGTLSTDRLNVSKLSALSANLGDVTTGSLKGVDIVAKTFSTPNASFTTDASGAITAKNMTLMGGTLTSPTINASTINGSTINGTTFNAGNKLNQYGNTNYPLTISSDGSLNNTTFKTIDTETAALRTSLKDGTLITNLRGMTPFDTGKYSATDTALGAGQLALFAGYSTSQDPNFSATGLSKTGYVILDAGTGLNLHGDTQRIHFNGLSTDITPKGIAFTPYGNINATGTQGTWYVGNGPTMLTASFGIDSVGSNPINFYRPLFVDEIGGLTSGGGNQLLIHGNDNGKSGSTGQMLFKKDSTGPIVASASIYNRTYSGGSTVTVTGYGTLGRITSASKYKLAIAREPQVEPADRLLTINPSSWVDLEAAKGIADNKSNGKVSLEREQSLERHHGLIAEDLRDAGLDEFVIYGEGGEIEGIQYDRLWTVLIPKIKQLNNRVNELERKTI